MTHLLCSLLIVAIAGCIVPLAFAREEPQPTIEGWGKVIDPDGDCRIGFTSGILSIVIPPTLHDLSAEAGKMNAPRVVENIEGDFIAQVRISGNFHHAGERTSDHFLA
jgi:hypothetical protein